jgi:uncharacterized protein YbjQ (UPF0145 family)
MSQQMPSKKKNVPARTPKKPKNTESITEQFGFFTSDLSVNEFLFIREAGFHAVGLVVGSCVYHIGYQQTKWGQNQEMGVLTQAMYDARVLAMESMKKEAKVLHADGIVGVRLEVTRHEGEAIAEFVAMGTAIRAEDSQSFRDAGGKFFSSDLCAQDFWTLRRAGYWPVDAVMGNCVYHVAHQGLGQWLSQIGQNVELTNYTEALYGARELAMQRMQKKALALKAEGVVGVHILMRNHGWHSHVIEFFSIGTAVRSVSTEQKISPPSLSILLNK